MTCLDRGTFDEAGAIAAEIAVFEPQRAAQLLRAFRLRWMAWAYHYDRAQGEDRVGDAWIALIEAYDQLIERGQP